MSAARGRRAWAWAGGAALAALALRLPSLNLLLDRDEGEYATLAWLWRTRAGLPYRDWLEQKPPLAVALNALAQTLCPDGVLGLRLLSLAWTLATVLGLFLLVERLAARGRLGRRLGQDPDLRAACAGLCGLAGAVLLSGCRTQALAANTETWQSLPLLAALALALGLGRLPGSGLPAAGRPGRARLLLAGACVGAASLFKQPALVGAPLLAWVAQGEGDAFLPGLVWTLAGALLPWAAAWATFAAQGAGPDFLYCVLGYDQGYVAQGMAGAWGRGLGLGRRLLPELGAWAGLAVLGWRALGREGAGRRWLAAWLLVGLASLAASGRFYPHYAVPLLAPLALLGGFGLAGLLPGAPGWSPRRLPRFLRLALLAWAAAGYAWCDGALWLRPDAASRTLRVYGWAGFVEAPLAARRIQQLCPPDKKLFIWGDEAELYYLSGRRPSSRFLFVYPFTGEAPAWPGGEAELLAGELGPDTGAAALDQPLDRQDPLQQRVLDGLNGQYGVDRGVPGYILGARKR